MRFVQFCPVISPVCWENYQILFLVKGTDCSGLTHPKFGKRPLWIEVLWNLLHELEHMLWVLGLSPSFALFSLYDPIACEPQFWNREDVNSSFVRSTSQPFGFRINCYAVELSFIWPSSEFSQQVTRMRIVETDNGSFLRRSGEQRTILVESDAGKWRVVGFYHILNFSFLLLVNMNPHSSLLLIRAS